MPKRTLLLLAFCYLAEVSMAQTPLTLQQCIDTALDRSLQLKSDNLDLAKTRAYIGQEYSNFLPTISASGSYQYYFQVQEQLIPAGLFGGTPGKYIAASLTAPQSKTFSAKLTQTLFDASSLIALKAAKVEVNLNQLQIRSSKEDLVYNVSATYYNIQSILKQQQLAQSNLETTQALLQVTTDQLKAGLATQTDADRLTVQRDNNAATVESTGNNLEKEFNLLKVLMNVPLESNITLPVEEYDESVTAATQAAAVFNPAQKTNYLQVLENKKVALLQKQNIAAGYLPSLSLSGSYGISGYNTNADPFENLNNKWYPASYVSLNLSIPIFDGFSKKYQLRQQETVIKKYDVQAEQTLQQNSKDVANAYADLKSNYITLQTQQRNLQLAQKVLTDINTQYKSGIAKLTDALNAQSDLQTAQNNYLTALINIRQAILDLKKAQGILINY